MSARILVVDDNPINIKLLSAKLARDYYLVQSADNGAMAVSMAKIEQPDLILLDVMMPEMDGFETCRLLKADPDTRHIPIVMVTALSDTADRVKGLNCGADDFLTKPINDVALMARVRSCLRLKMMMDEWRMREATAAKYAPPLREISRDELRGRVLVLEDDPVDQRKIAETLNKAGMEVETVETANWAATEAASGEYDLCIVSIDLAKEDGLFLCAQLRAREATRSLPLLLTGRDDEIDKVARGLDLGANDYVVRPFDGSELVARVRGQIRQKWHHDRLKSNLESSLALALVDPLTGAYNRRYMDMHLPKIMNRCLTSGNALSLLSLDLDFFKKINDTYGHAAGDLVLKNVVACLMKNLRPTDLVVRMGGEEFAAILPDTDMGMAMMAAERLREAVEASPAVLPDGGAPVTVTMSIGVAAVNHQAKDDTPDKLLHRADAALYTAKERGRNRVVGEQR